MSGAQDGMNVVAAPSLFRSYFEKSDEDRKQAPRYCVSHFETIIHFCAKKKEKDFIQIEK